jgi:prepilin-type N-terminal cleavage/methylation domain-containing protein
VEKMGTVQRAKFWDRSGFNLIELVIVLGMIGIITAAALMVFGNTRERGLVANFYTELRTIKLAAISFEADLGFFPLEVGRGVDPGLTEKYGWQDGPHSGAWNVADAKGMLDNWHGPYLPKWKKNPWGGSYDWDNFPPGYSYMGINGGAVFLTLRPDGGAGDDGVPSDYYERLFEKDGLDVVNGDNLISIWIGQYPAP